jgi:hypothetical protein
MASPLVPPRFVRSHELEPNVPTESLAWGKYVRYIEFGEDRFPLRQVDVYANGKAVAYDRERWYDQYGTLGDFRFGDLWISHWGNPMSIPAEEFAEVWQRAELMRSQLNATQSKAGPPPWIQLFESGAWKGQR